MTLVALDKVGCRVFSSLFGQGMIPYGHLILPSLFSELHAVQLHCWRKCQLNNKLTPPCDVPLSCIGMPYLQTEHCTPSPVAQCKSLFFHNTLLLHRDSPLKGAFKWPNFLSQFPRIVITRKRRTNSMFWHHFWRGFESSFPNQFPNWKLDYFCAF